MTCEAPGCPWGGPDGDTECLLDTGDEPQDYDGYVNTVINCARMA